MVRPAGPDFAVRVTSNTAFFLHVVVVGPNIVVCDRPVGALAIERTRLKVLFMQARPYGIVMHRAAADAVACIKDIADGVFAVLDNRIAAPFQPSCPDSRADEVIIAALRPCFEDDYFLATNSKLRRDYTTGRTRADDDRIDFFIWHVQSPHLLGGSMCAMYGMPSDSTPSCVP